MESGDHKPYIDFIPPFLSSAIDSMNEMRHFIGSVWWPFFEHQTYHLGCSEGPHPFCFWVCITKLNTWASMPPLQPAQPVWILFYFMYIYLHDSWQMYMNESPKQARCLSTLAATPSATSGLTFSLIYKFKKIIYSSIWFFLGHSYRKSVSFLLF